VKLIKHYEIFKLNINKFKLNPKTLVQSTTNKSICRLKMFFFFRTENDLETKQKEIEIHQNELARLRQQLSQIELNHLDLQNHFEQLKQTNQQLEKHSEEKDQSKRNLDLLVDQHRQQFDDEKQLRISTSIDSKFVFFLFSLSKILKINWKFFELKIRKQKSISNN